MDINQIASPLALDDIIVRKCIFERNTDDPFTDNHLKIQLAKSVKETESQNKFFVDLKILVTNAPKEFEVGVSVHSIFSLNPENEFSEEQRTTLLNRNTMAMLVPFIRSQVCLITSQPGMKPIIIPPIDINRMVDQISQPNEAD